MLSIISKIGFRIFQKCLGSKYLPYVPIRVAGTDRQSSADFRTLEKSSEYVLNVTAL